MIAIITLLVAFPAGYLIRSRQAANLTYIAAYGYAFTFQNVYLIRSWVGGDDSALPKDPDSMPISYLVVSVAIYAAGFGLVAVGRWVRSRRDARRAVGGRGAEVAAVVS
jgi:hypothetical protein